MCLLRILSGINLDVYWCPLKILSETYLDVYSQINKQTFILATLEHWFFLVMCDALLSFSGG